MKPVDKARAYAYLKYIKENNGIDVTPYVHEVASNVSVTEDVIIFINKYLPLEQLYTYNKIHENRRKNPLYKNLVNENLSESDMAIALSSFVTQSMIHNKELLKESKNSDSEKFLNIMNLDEVLEALSQYINGDATKLHESFNMIRDVFKKLF